MSSLKARIQEKRLSNTDTDMDKVKASVSSVLMEHLAESQAVHIELPVFVREAVAVWLEGEGFSVTPIKSILADNVLTVQVEPSSFVFSGADVFIDGKGNVIEFVDKRDARTIGELINNDA